MWWLCLRMRRVRVNSGRLSSCKNPSEYLVKVLEPTLPQLMGRRILFSILWYRDHLLNIYTEQWSITSPREAVPHTMFVFCLFLLLSVMCVTMCVYGLQKEDRFFVLVQWLGASWAGKKENRHVWRHSELVHANRHRRILIWMWVHFFQRFACDLYHTLMLVEDLGIQTLTLYDFRFMQSSWQ